jgi:hypothetical protein
MALSNIVKTGLDSGTIKIKDGTGTPLELTVRFDRGDFSISGIQQGLREAVEIQSRGSPRSLRKGRRSYPTGSMSLWFTDFSETGTGTIFDMIHGKSGTPFAARISTTVAKGDLMTFDVELTEEGTDYGDSADHTLTMQDVHFSEDYSEGEDGNSITLNFTVYGSLADGIVETMS